MSGRWRRALPGAGAAPAGGRMPLNRRPSPLLARSLPWLSVMIGSLATAAAWIASAPILPPFGLMMLIAWRQLRPGLLPIWAGLPLGAFDDLYSGQPLGSAILLWSLVMIALEWIEARLPWRNLVLDWLIAAALIALALLLALVFANLAGASAGPALLVPQLVLAVLTYPLIGRIVAASDRFRLRPLFTVGGWF